MVRPRQRRPRALSLRCQEAGNLNGHYLREADDARLAGLVAPRVETLVDRPLDAADRARLTRATESLKPRAKTLDEIADGAVFIFLPDALPMEEKTATLLSDAPAGLIADVTRSEEHI